MDDKWRKELAEEISYAMTQVEDRALDKYRAEQAYVGAQASLEQLLWMLRYEKPKADAAQA